MIDRVQALAVLGDPDREAEPIRRRAAAGDQEGAWLLGEWDQGHVLLARLTITAQARDPRGREVAVCTDLHGVWLERDEPAAVEGQVADAAPSSLAELANQLRRRGVTVADEQLEKAFLHVELGPDLRRALDAR